MPATVVSCALNPGLLDYSTVAIGSSRSMTFTVENPSPASFRVVLAAPEAKAGRASAWSFGVGYLYGEYVVPASANGEPGRLTIPVVFKPTDPGTYSAELPITSPHADCPSALQLTGNAVERIVGCEPTVLDGDVSVCRVDFGIAQPGLRAVRQARLWSGADHDITVVLGSVVQPPNNTVPFSIVTAERTFVLRQGGQPVTVDLAFEPTQLGQQFGKLNFATDDPGSATGVVELVGFSGGPRIEVAPAAVDFGDVAVDTYKQRRLTIANVGTDSAGTTDDNLVFAVPDANGALVERRPELSGPGAAQFSFEWPPESYTQTGLSEGQNADLHVRFNPHVAGVATAVLTIYSNDPASPTTVTLTGNGVSLPPCNYEVVPPSVDFGAVESNRSLTLSFVVVNRGPPQDACLLSSFEVTGAGSWAFSLPDGDPASASTVLLHGGESLAVPVQFHPRSDGQYTGAVSFYVSSPTSSLATVNLSGIAQPRCILIAPNDLDFGTVGLNCNSAQRTISVYNTCTSTVTVSSVATRAGSSSDFQVTQMPGLPASIPGGSAPATIGVTYHPIDSGADFGTLALTLSGNVNPYVIALSGRGATKPVQTDVFTEPEQPKLDILFVVDDSASMWNKADSLARNFASFIHYAVQQHVDYHIAVTTTSLDSSSFACGRLLPLTGSNPRVITPSTPNKEQVFLQNIPSVNSGGIASLIRPAFLALNNPLISGHNAGFYRDEARLAVVAVSDDIDADPLSTPVSFYENFFVNLKGLRRRSEFTYSAVIPLNAQDPPAGSECTYGSPGAGLDARAKQLAQRTGGLVDDICNPDWATTLNQVYSRAAGTTTTYFLTSVPDMTASDPITLTIDGQAYPAIGSHGETRWTYDSARNAVEFDRLAMPSAGAVVRITYGIACL